MGGFVARAVLTLPTFNRGSVNTILTLNTPHRYHFLLIIIISPKIFLIKVEFY